MRKSKNIVKIILIILVAIYTIFALVNQQKALNEYAQDSKELAKQIKEEQEYNKELLKKKENIDSLDFIEQTAREKLDMYYPNERVYIDTGI